MSYCPQCAKLERELAEEHELFGKQIDRGVKLVDDIKSANATIATLTKSLEEARKEIEWAKNQFKTQAVREKLCANEMGEKLFTACANRLDAFLSTIGGGK